MTWLWSSRNRCSSLLERSCETLYRTRHFLPVEMQELACKPWCSTRVCSVVCVWNHVLHTLTLSAFGLHHEHISKNVADMYPNSTWAFGCGCDGNWLHSINIYTQYFQDPLPSVAHLPLTAWWSSNRPKEEDCIGAWYSNQWSWPGLNCTSRPVGDGRMSKNKTDKWKFWTETTKIL